MTDSRTVARNLKEDPSTSEGQTGSAENQSKPSQNQNGTARERAFTSEVETLYAVK